MFWFSFVICGYWFIIYKMQDNAYLLMPSKEESVSLQSIFLVVFLIMFVCENGSIFYQVYRQCTIDVFLMDWEHPRKVNVTDQEESVVTWRSIFIGNEFNELQAEKRLIYPATTLVWFAFFWVGMGWGRIS